VFLPGRGTISADVPQAELPVESRSDEENAWEEACQGMTSQEKAEFCAKMDRMRSLHKQQCLGMSQGRGYYSVELQMLCINGVISGAQEDAMFIFGCLESNMLNIVFDAVHAGSGVLDQKQASVACKKSSKWSECRSPFAEMQLKNIETLLADVQATNQELRRVVDRVGGYLTDNGMQVGRSPRPALISPCVFAHTSTSFCREDAYSYYTIPTHSLIPAPGLVLFVEPYSHQGPALG
jgi:hypothetical protein